MPIRLKDLGKDPAAYLEQLIIQNGLPAPEREQQLISGRRYRVDFLWRSQRVIVEFEGGLWIKGAHSHTHPSHIERDIQKYNLLTLSGWKVYRVTVDHIVSGYAFELVSAALGVADPVTAVGTLQTLERKIYASKNRGLLQTLAKRQKGRGDNTRKFR